MTDIVIGLHDGQPYPSHEAAAAAATADLAKRTADFHALPDQQLARAERYAAGLGNDAVAQENARREVARLRGVADRAEQARITPDIVPPTATQPLDQLDRAFLLVDQEAAAGRIIGTGMETTVDGGMTLRDMMTAVQEYRGLGMNDACIREAIYGATCPASVIQEAKERLEQRYSDPAWTTKLAAQDRATRKEFTLLNIVINARVQGAAPQ